MTQNSEGQPEDTGPVVEVDDTVIDITDVRIPGHDRICTNSLTRGRIRHMEMSYMSMPHT